MNFNKMEITLDIEPVPWQRPGFNKNKKRAYTQKNTRQFKKLIEQMIWIQTRKYPFILKGRLNLTCAFYLTREPSVRRKSPCTKPDLDNLLKAVLDSMEGYVYKNDSQITKYAIEKLYADECPPRIELTIEEY